MFVSYPSIIDNEEDDEQDRNERGKKSRDEAAVDVVVVVSIVPSEAVDDTEVPTTLRRCAWWCAATACAFAGTVVLIDSCNTIPC